MPRGQHQDDDMQHTLNHSITAQTIPTKTTLLSLPSELHRLIFDHLSTIETKWTFLQAHPIFWRNTSVYFGSFYLSRREQQRHFKTRTQNLLLTHQYPRYISDVVCIFSQLPDTHLPNKTLLNAAAAVGNQSLCQWFLEQGPFGQRFLSGELKLNFTIFDKALFNSAFSSRNEKLILYLLDIIQEGCSIEDQQSLIKKRWFSFLLKQAIRAAFSKSVDILIAHYALIPDTNTLMDSKVLSAATRDPKATKIWKRIACTHPDLLTVKQYMMLLDEIAIYSAQTGMLRYWIQRIHTAGYSLPAKTAQTALYQAIKTADMACIYLLNQHYKITLHDKHIDAAEGLTKMNIPHQSIRSNLAYLLSDYADQLTPNQIQYITKTAAFFGFDNIVAFSLKQYAGIHTAFYSAAIKVATAQGHLGIIRFLRPYVDNTVTGEMMVIATLKGQLSIIEELYHLEPHLHWDTNLLLQLAAQSGQFNTFQYLLNRVETNSQQTFDYITDSFKAAIDWNTPISWPDLWAEPEWRINKQSIRIAQHLLQHYPHVLRTSNSLPILLEVPDTTIDPTLVTAHIRFSLDFANQYARLHADDLMFQMILSVYIEHIAQRGYIEPLYDLIIENIYPNLKSLPCLWPEHVETALNTALKAIEKTYKKDTYCKDTLTRSYDVCHMSYQLLIHYHLEKTSVGARLLSLYAIEGELKLMLDLVKHRNQQPPHSIENDKKIVDQYFFQDDLPKVAQKAYQEAFASSIQKNSITIKYK